MKCHCVCHDYPDGVVMHIIACCDGADQERVERIKRYRFERGKEDALRGEPPTESSIEYQKGYEEGSRDNR